MNRQSTATKLASSLYYNIPTISESEKIMQQEVYADLLFLINFSMDFLCLFLTSRILHHRLSPIFAALASALGGVYSILALFIVNVPFLQLLLDLLVCSLICILGFLSAKQSIKQYFRIIAVYILCASALGGIMTAMFNLFNKLNLPINHGGDHISAWLFLLLASISGITALKGTKFLRRLSSGKITDVEIIFCGQKLRLRGMTDTGNMLRDPILGKPVIVTDICTTAPILPTAIHQAVTQNKIEYLSDLPPQYSGKVRLISGKSVSGDCLLIGLVPDKIVIYNSRGAINISALFAPTKLHNLPDHCTAIIPGELNK